MLLVAADLDGAVAPDRADLVVLDVPGVVMEDLGGQVLLGVDEDVLLAALVFEGELVEAAALVGVGAHWETRIQQELFSSIWP